MKHFFLLVLLCLFAISGLAAQSLKGKTVYVAIKSGNLKSSTDFFANNTGSVKYGDSFKVIQEKEKWVEVQGISNQSLRGWIASGNVTTKKIVSSGSSASASADELALAGKGFSQEVERSYRQSESLNYNAIDSMEALKISEKEIHDFLIEGHLETGAEL